MNTEKFAETLYYYNEQCDKIDKYTLSNIVQDEFANYILILGDKIHRTLSVSIHSYALGQFKCTFKEALEIRRESILTKIQEVQNEMSGLQYQLEKLTSALIKEPKENE